MKNDKVCFSKTLAYLVLLVAVIVGAFYVVDYANKQQKSTKTEASGRDEVLCPIWHSSFSNVTNKDQRHRYVMYDSTNKKCYGYTGWKNSYDTRGYVYNANNIAACIMQELPCQYDKVVNNKKVKEYDVNICPITTTFWAPKSNPTGSSHNAVYNKAGKMIYKPFYAYQDICVRQSGYRVSIFARGTQVGSEDDNKYSEGYYRCETTTQGVTQWDCDKTNITPTKDPYSSADKKTPYIINAPDYCPTNMLVWRSAMVDIDGNPKDAQIANYTTLKNAAKDPNWDICLKLTGKAEVMKQITGKSTKTASANNILRCLTQNGPNLKSLILDPTPASLINSDTLCNGSYKTVDGLIRTVVER